MTTETLTVDERRLTLEDAWEAVERLGPALFEWGGMSLSGYRCGNGGCEHDFNATALGPNGEAEFWARGLTPVEAVTALLAEMEQTKAERLGTPQ